MNCALVRLCFLRLLGAVYLIAFLSLAAQVLVLLGSEGLQPACTFLQAVRLQAAWWQLPTLFHFACSDSILLHAAVVGATLSLLLLFGVLPRITLLGLWCLYLSFVSGGRVFFAFQWDNLLLEATFFALFVAPWRGRGLGAQPPHPAAVFLFRWLLLRLHVESGLAKLLSGDPSWHDLTAMATYYETAPLPTCLAWFAHQLPLTFHRASSAAVLLAELVVPFGLFGPRRLRRWTVGVLLGLQSAIVATANYGFFNYLTMALCLWGLDDDDLRGFRLWLPDASTAGCTPRVEQRVRPRVLWLLASLLAAVSLVPFFSFVPRLKDRALGLRAVLEPWRTLNAYHLFAAMTYVRREAVLEISEDARNWRELHFRYKPGDPRSSPPFVAPHQPRVDFQLWFLLLRGEPRAPYFFSLLEAVLSRPWVVAPLFADFPVQRPPRFVRVAVYQYRFSDWSTGWREGVWWVRERLGESQPFVPTHGGAPLFPVRADRTRSGG